MEKQIIYAEHKHSQVFVKQAKCNRSKLEHTNWSSIKKTQDETSQEMIIWDVTFKENTLEKKVISKI